MFYFDPVALRMAKTLWSMGHLSAIGLSLSVLLEEVEVSTCPTVFEHFITKWSICLDTDAFLSSDRKVRGI